MRNRLAYIAFIFIGALLFVLGFMFRIQHAYGSNAMFYTGQVLLAMSLIVYFVKFRKKRI